MSSPTHDIEWSSSPTHPSTIPGDLEAIRVLEERQIVGERIKLFLTFFNLILTFFCTKSRKKARIIYIKKIQNYMVSWLDSSWLDSLLASQLVNDQKANYSHSE